MKTSLKRRRRKGDEEKSLNDFQSNKRDKPGHIFKRKNKITGS